MTTSDLLIYTADRRIFMRKKNGESYTRPLLLAADYDRSLCYILCDSVLYYSYINQENTLLIRNSNDFFPFFRIENAEGIEYPALFSLNNQLVLLYYLCGESGMTLNCELIMQPGNQRTLIDDLYSAIFEAKPHVDYDALQEENASWHQKVAFLQQENSMLRNQLESAKKQYNELMEVAQKYRAEAQKWQNKFIGGRD